MAEEQTGGRDALRRGGFIAAVGPGLLLAATGVGAGDLATASLVGMEVGVGVLWAVALGAFLKYVLNEGIARYQLGAGATVLEGASARLGPAFRLAFFLYLIPWSFFVGAALMGACGVTAHAIFPLGDAASDKQLYGALHGLAGAALAAAGGYRLFEGVMKCFIVLMFLTVAACAVFIAPDWAAVARGFVWPALPLGDVESLRWTVALMGGVGGTLTVLCYGYWLREEGRSGPGQLRACRWDLGAGYAATGLFGAAMVIIGSQVTAEGSGASLVVNIGAALEGPLGPAGKWAFFIGAWGAVFSSLLGVWQSVPYLFADALGLAMGDDEARRAARVSTRSASYRGYLAALALVPMLGLFIDFRVAQQYYAVLGASLMPVLALLLLYLNGARGGGAPALRNRPAAVAVLGFAVLFFAAVGALEIAAAFGWAGA